MTQEEKQLLLKDLCARLPYGVKIELHGEICTVFGIVDDYVQCTADVPTDQQSMITNVKPYLRPMSSMTEDEKNELNKHYLCITIGDHITLKYHSEGYWDNDTETEFKDYLWLENWLNEHHFDYRGLIPMGLALEAKEDMYD